MVPRKTWVSKPFFKGLEVSVSCVFLRLGVSKFFTDRSRSLGFFSFCLVFRSRIFQSSGVHLMEMSE